MRPMSSFELAKSQANIPTAGTLKREKTLQKPINFDRVDSWQCTETKTKSVNDVTELDDENTIQWKQDRTLMEIKRGKRGLYQD